MLRNKKFQIDKLFVTILVLISGILSAQEKKGTFKIQRASSSMKIDSGKHTTIGYDYQLRKSSKIFVFYSQLESSNKRKAKDIFSIGIEHKF